MEIVIFFFVVEIIILKQKILYDSRQKVPLQKLRKKKIVLLKYFRVEQIYTSQTRRYNGIHFSIIVKYCEKFESEINICN